MEPSRPFKFKVGDLVVIKPKSELYPINANSDTNHGKTDDKHVIGIVTRSFRIGRKGQDYVYALVSDKGHWCLYAWDCEHMA